MSDQEQLPVCVLCGNAPAESDDGSSVFCADVDCEMLGVWLTVDAWRRLMARPRLAPEHVAAFVAMRDRLFGAGSVPTVGGQTVGHEIMRVILTGQERGKWMAAIRAALAALGEVVRR